MTHARPRIHAVPDEARQPPRRAQRGRRAPRPDPRPRRSRVASIADGTLAPAIVSQKTTARSSEHQRQAEDRRRDDAGRCADRDRSRRSAGVVHGALRRCARLRCRSSCTASSRKLAGQAVPRSSSARAIAASAVADVRASLRPLQRDLPAEALAGCLLARDEVGQLAGRAAPASTCASPSSRRIAIQRAFGHAGRRRFDQRHQLGRPRAETPACPSTRSGVVVTSPRRDLGDRLRAARADPRWCARRSAPPARRDRAPGCARRPRCPLRLASSIRLTATTTRSVISSTCSTRFRLRSSARGVHDDDGAVGLAEQQEVARDLFVLRRREQRVGARQVDELVADLVELEAAFGARDRLAGPVAGVLLEAGQRVEQRRLAGVRVAGQRDDAIELVELDAHLREFGVRRRRLSQLCAVIARLPSATARRRVDVADEHLRRLVAPQRDERAADS